MTTVFRNVVLAVIVAAVIAACWRVSSPSKVSLSGGPGAAAADPAPKSLPWSPDLDSAIVTAKAQKKPMMIDLYTDWCEWCKKLDANVFPDATVGIAASNFVPVRLNAEIAGQQVAQRFGISEFPTIIFLDPDGSLVGRISGYMDPPEFAKTLDRIAGDCAAFPGLVLRERQHTASVDDEIRLAGIYIHRNDLKSAKSLVDSVSKRGGTTRLGTVYNMLGDLSAQAGDANQAIRCFNATVTHSTEIAPILVARQNLFGIYYNQKRFDQAKAEIKAVINMPNAPAAVRASATKALAQVSEAQENAANTDQ